MMGFEDDERARARRDVQIGRKPGFLESSAYRQEYQSAEASAGMGVAVIVCVPIIALGAAGMLLPLIGAVIGLVVLVLAIKIIGPRIPAVPAPVWRGLTWLALATLALLAILYAIGLYQDRQRAAVDAAIDARAAAMVARITNAATLPATLGGFTDPARRAVAIVQDNLRHMPVDPGQNLEKGDLNWKYWGAIDGNWQSMDGAVSSICGPRLERKFGVPAGLTFSVDEACKGNTYIKPPEHIDRLVVFTTEMRLALTAKYCALGLKERWNNCPVKSGRRH